MTLRERLAKWLMPGVDELRAVPIEIDPRDSVTVTFTGQLNPSDAAEFTADIAKWRAGEGNLYLPAGTRLLTTRRKS